MLRHRWEVGDGVSGGPAPILEGDENWKVEDVRCSMARLSLDALC